jgi:endonuclease/exonuclease/phosphatase family metal-dependent hydrolase
MEEARFTSYNKDETPLFRRYGFFSVYIRSKEKSLFRLITTHLQPGAGEKDGIYRKNQIRAISDKIKEEGLPVILCGDLNTVKGSKEAEELFAGYVPSGYSGADWTCCELRDYWWKASQNVGTFLKLPPHKEWLDYFFLMKNQAGKKVTLSTEVLVANDPAKPENALSDHQILLTNVSFGED